MRSTPFKSVLCLLVPAVLLCSLAGCRTMTHKEASLKAQARWNQVRGQVKYQLASQQLESGQFSDAVKSATESLSLDPSQPATYVVLVKANLELGKRASADRALTAAQREGLDSADLHYLRGVVLEQQGDDEGALQRFRAAREMRPDEIDFVVAEAETYVALSRPDEALTLIEKSRNNVDDETLVVLRAYIAALVGDREEALEQSGRAWETKHDNPLIVQTYGRHLADAGRYQQALRVLAPLVGTPYDTPPRGSLRRTMAECHLALGDASSARDALMDYVQSHPTDSSACILLAKAAVATNDIVTALRALDWAQPTVSDRPEFWMVRAAVNYQRGRWPEASRDLYDLITNHPDDVEAHCLLGEVLRAMDQREGAQAYFERALALDSQCAWAKAGLASLQDKARAGKPSGRMMFTSTSAPSSADTTRR